MLLNYLCLHCSFFCYFSDTFIKMRKDLSSYCICDLFIFSYFGFILFIFPILSIVGHSKTLKSEEKLSVPKQSGFPSWTVPSQRSDASLTRYYEHGGRKLPLARQLPWDGERWDGSHWQPCPQHRRYSGLHQGPGPFAQPWSQHSQCASESWSGKSWTVREAGPPNAPIWATASTGQLWAACFSWWVLQGCI